MSINKCRSNNRFRKLPIDRKAVVESVMRNRYLNILKMSPYKLLTYYKVKILTSQWRIFVDHHQEIKANISGTSKHLLTPDIKY